MSGFMISGTVLSSNDRYKDLLSLYIAIQSTLFVTHVALDRYEKPAGKTWWKFFKFSYPDTEKQFKIQNLEIFNPFIKQSIIFQSYRTQEVTTLGKAVAA